MQTLQNRTISREHFEQLHEGMVRLAKRWNWTVTDEPDPADPTLVTLVSLGLALPPEAETIDPPEPTDAALEEPDENTIVIDARSAIDDDQWDGDPTGPDDEDDEDDEDDQDDEE